MPIGSEDPAGTRADDEAGLASSMGLGAAISDPRRERKVS